MKCLSMRHFQVQEPLIVSRIVLENMGKIEGDRGGRKENILDEKATHR